MAHVHRLTRAALYHKLLCTQMVSNSSDCSRQSGDIRGFFPFLQSVKHPCRSENDNPEPDGSFRKPNIFLQANRQNTTQRESPARAPRIPHHSRSRRTLNTDAASRHEIAWPLLNLPTERTGGRAFTCNAQIYTRHATPLGRKTAALPQSIRQTAPPRPPSNIAHPNSCPKPERV